MNHRISFCVVPECEAEAFKAMHKWRIEFDATSTVENGVDMVRISATVEDELYILQAVCSMLDALNAEDESFWINLRVEQIPESR